MFRISDGPVVVSGGRGEAVIMPQLIVIVVRALGDGAGDGMIVGFFDVAKELVEGAVGFGRNILWHPGAHPPYDRDVVRGWISLLFSRKMRKRT